MRIRPDSNNGLYRMVAYSAFTQLANDLAQDTYYRRPLSYVSSDPIAAFVATRIIVIKNFNIISMSLNDKGSKLYRYTGIPQFGFKGLFLYSMYLKYKTDPKMSDKLADYIGQCFKGNAKQPHAYYQHISI